MSKVSSGVVSSCIRLFVILFLCAIVGCLMSVICPSIAVGTEATTITDTQNLLGSGLTRVSDEVESIHRTTGVTVDLLYLPSFDTNLSSQQWAENQLRSTHPKRNTVMLAVASQKGQMVVVVSDNSDHWLKNTATVSALSDAAAKPLNAASPDWSGAALSLCDEIATQHRQAQHAPVRRAWLIVGIVLAVIVVGGVVVLLVIAGKRGLFTHHAGAHAGTPARRQRKTLGRKKRRRSSRHAPRHAL